MKNKDVLLDVIGEVDDSLIPMHTKKRFSRSRAVIGGVLAAALIAGMILILPKGNRSPAVVPSATEAMSAQPSEGSATPTDAQEPTVLKIAQSSVKALASAEYPAISAYLPDGSYDRTGFTSFFENSTQVFLSGAENDNRVYSPLSLFMALGMTAEATDGDSRQQILDALGQEDIDALRSYAKLLWEANYSYDSSDCACLFADSLWTNSRWSYCQSTLDRIAENYYASSFSGDPAKDEFGRAMRKWINEQTDDLLTDYASQIEPDPATVLALVSTVNYTGKWVSDFLENHTREDVFHAPSGDIRCEFMNKERTDTYYWGENFGSVTLPIKNNGAMKLILPDEGVTPEELLRDAEALRYMSVSAGDAYENSKEAVVTLSVPKFDVSSSIGLEDSLAELGVTDIFEPGAADFTPLTDESDELYVSQAEQDARVMIDEKGCKAVAVTEMGAAAGAAKPPEEKVEFILDRPFIFEIISKTGFPLFVGVVNNPTA